MNLQTKITIPKETRNSISYHSKVLLLGSCFSENIGNKFQYFKFQSTQNPFGILFHPIAIEHFITDIINEKIYIEEDLIFNNERWHYFNAHSNMSATNKKQILDNLNNVISTSNKYVKEVSHIIITLGTSWVYRFIETDSIVANCHKIPQKKFLKEILSVNEITESLYAIIALIKSVNKNVDIIFTVSPVRHLKDGFIENNRSKSHLLTAIHQITAPKNKIHYFPSYEIMMDELRDYRFYAEDMIHPSSTAIKYIWNVFSKVWITEEAHETMQKVETIQKGLSHKPFNEKSEQHIKFLKSLDDKITTLKKSYNFINFHS